MTPISGTGGQLPPGAASPTASNLLADYTSLTTEQKAAFRQAIAPVHHMVEEAVDVVTLLAAVPGDTAGVTGNSNYIFMLTATAPAVNTNWTNLLTGTAAPAE